MGRRSTPQKQIDDRAFPVRVRIVVPETGHGSRMDAMLRWLDQELGRREFAWHSGGSGWPGFDASAVYFRHPRDAARFMEAFGELQLADGTTSAGYTSPYRPLGR